MATAAMVGGWDMRKLRITTNFFFENNGNGIEFHQLFKFWNACSYKYNFEWVFNFFYLEEYGHVKGRCLFEFFLLKKACPVYSRFTFSFRFFLCSLNLIMFVYFRPRDAEKLESHTIPLCLHEYNDSLLNPTTIKRLEYLVSFSDHFSKSI